MDYKIPDDIKILCEKDNLKDPKEQESVKQELVKFLTAYLSLDEGADKGKNSLANVTDIVSKDGEFPVKGAFNNYPFQRDVAGRMMRTRNYTMQEGINEANKKEVYVIAADRSLWDRYKLLFTLLTAAAGTLFGIMADPLKGLLHTESNNQYLIRDTIQVRLQTTNPTLPPIDTVYNLQIEKPDSAK